MRRRTLLEAFGAAAIGWRLTAFAQPATGVRRVAVLAPSTRPKEERILKPFFDGMRDLGWVEGRNIVYDLAYAEEDHARLPALMAEIVKRKPEVIFAPPTPAAMVASRGSRDIPVVFSMNVDPVAVGLVRNLARPGGNVTGVTYSFSSIAPKRIEVLKQLMPGIARVGVLFDPGDPGALGDLRALEETSASFGVMLITAPVRSPKEIDAAVRDLLAQTPGAVLITGTLLYNLRLRVHELAASKRVPVIGASLLAEEGGLFAYGFSLAERIYRAAYFVDRILKGAKPGELPVEQISKMELVLNLKVIKALGVNVPPALLLRADRVVE